MNRVKFSVDWDKLRAPQFTTIRSYNLKKEKYYRSLIGQEFTVLRVPHEFAHPSKGRKVGSATLRSVSVILPRNLPAIELQTDVMLGGKPDQKWLDRLLAMDKALLLEFENHTGLLK